jgi:hypothetical protein
LEFVICNLQSLIDHPRATTLGLLALRRAVLRYICRLLAAYRLPSGKHTGILTHFQTQVNKKMTKKITFFGHPERSRRTY